MNRFRRYITLVLVFSFVMATPALAAVKASKQISSYALDAVPRTGGKISIDFDITGTGMMKQIGADSIEIYEDGSYGWTLVESYDQDDPGISEMDTFMHGDTIYFYGESGTDYMIYVSVFAEDYDGGSDSRDDTFYVTAK